MHPLCPSGRCQKPRVTFRFGRSAAILAVFFCGLFPPNARTQIAAQSPDPANAAVAGKYAGDQACAKCHREIFVRYQETAMAHASGPITGNVIPGEFTHKLSGVRYRIKEENGRVWLHFDRDAGDVIHGRRELLYYIGSGRLGRSYIFEESGFYFESPVNWYGQKQVWDMTPAYQEVLHVPLNLPLNSSCVTCHVSIPENPAPGTTNKYEEPLMAQNGIGCERCHGAGAAHASGSGAIINPAKLSAVRRDSVCMQCHLEGNAAIQQPGRRLHDFRPGDDLQDYVHYFVWSGPGRDLRAGSQFEALAESACKRKSGDALSCISCHDPHYAPPEAEKAGYYRAKCLACHAKPARSMGRHFGEGRDCVGCHMPRVNSVDIAHTQATDHRIPRYAKQVSLPAQPQVQPELRSFPPTQGKMNDRDLALAWQALAQSGVEAALPEEEKYAKRALKQFPDDPALLSALGFLYQRQHKLELARSFEERAVQQDPMDTVAATDLGVIAAQTGSLQEAERLWRQAFEREPGSSAIGLNLSKALITEGKRKEARETVERVLEFNPDLPEAKQLLEQVTQH